MKSLLWLLAILIVLPVLLLAALQVQTGRTLLSSLVSDLASSGDMKITITDLGLSWGLDARARSVAIADREGQWLSVNGAEVLWSPLALLGGRVEINSVSVDDISIARAPLPAATSEDTAKDTASSGSFPILPGDLKALRINRIALGAPLLGEAIELMASGSAALARSPLEVSGALHVARLGGEEGTIDADVAFLPDAETLRFDLTVAEPRGGLVARLGTMPGLPAVDFKLTGDGPLSDWTAKLSAALDGRQTLSGTARLTENATGRQLSADLNGELAPLLPDLANAFFLGTTNLKLTAGLSQDFIPETGQMDLSTQTLRLSADGRFDPATSQIDVRSSLHAGADDGNLIALDLPERRVVFGPVQSDITLKGTLESASWSAKVNAAQLGTTEGKTEQVTLDLSGQSADLRPEALTSDFALELSASGIALADPALAALGGTIALSAKGTLSGTEQSATLAEGALTSHLLALTLGETRLSQDKVTSQGTLRIDDLARLSSLTGQQLSGGLTSSFTADLDPQALAGTVTLDASGRNLAAGIDALDALLTGDTSLKVEAAANGASDMTLTSFTLASSGLQASGSGSLKDGNVAAEVEAALNDLSKVDPQVEGGLSLTGSVDGVLDGPAFKADLSSEKLTLAGTPVDGLTLHAEGVASALSPEANVTLNGSMKGAPLKLDAVLKSENGVARIDPVSADIAGNKLSGQFQIMDLANALETLKGQLKIDAPVLASLSPLVLTEIAGALEGSLNIARQGSGPQTVQIDLSGSGIKAEGNSLDKLSLKATARDPFSVPKIDGDLVAEGLIAGSTPVRKVTLKASSHGPETVFDTTVDLSADGRGMDGLKAAGYLTQLDNGGFRIGLDKLDGSYQRLQTKLKAPAEITYADGRATLQAFALSLGSGDLSVSGTAGDQLNLKAQLNAVPLSLANAFAPQVGLGGTLSGTATATGPAASPAATWSVTASNLTAAVLRQQGLPAINVTSSGKMAGQIVTQETRVTGPDGLAVSINGTVGAKAPFPLRLSVDGNAPLAFARLPLIKAGFRGSGSFAITGTVGGTATAPTYSISARPREISLTDLASSLTLQNVTGSVDATQTGVTLSALRGEIAAGGSVTVSGTVGLGEGLPANIDIRADQARYIDPGLVNAVLDATLKIEGPLSSSREAMLVSGKVALNKADITIPETLPGSISPVAIRHVNAPKAVRQQVSELRGDTGAGNSSAGPANQSPRLDIAVSAPGRVFVRGRGIDAELFGDLTIRGTADAPQAIGGFTLRRGLIDILTRRLTFSRGLVTFNGTLTPALDFLATSSISSTTVTVAVNGYASDPAISFSSSPERPQDEVLALLLFNKEMGTLSPTQIAQLAAAISTLTGGSDNGPLAQLRKSLGLDAIDIDTSGSDGPTIGVGKYINDNIYLGVEQGTSDGNSRVKVDIDLNRGLKVRGEVGANGSSKAGIFFEKEY
ncbi:translocation/assembly module TamB domain-containing protein [Roseibium litorale]|uniref:Translocation/assembly module TamB domain-containing protein n=1 Tax=Roseibium litorale TaxID=2803841 RepID=A0ABR9CRG0_9HYPH|nr:translocation/assembly module TamB domain-containing protein [Roseibium litorale]MBD8892841.1 translocation/assembly module TamB domain-containing protein [Roseibium litorale]